MSYWQPLRPHPLSHHAAQKTYSVHAHASLVDTRLIVCFEVHDPVHEIFWPAPDQFKQCDYLWENTCFEVFINPSAHTRYFELNLSPSLAWNLYQFSDYRTPNTMPPQRVHELALTKFEVSGQTISAEIDLATLNLAKQTLNIGLTAVIKTQHSLEYLALSHSIDQADFHHSGGWTLSLSLHEEFHDSHGQ
ncbi:hypothetical protein [Aquirhabdus sp.]|uniref:hypothetical protein n=1 Tax=Aquirhabdus sp. TaxID=2824160 RepID=UPI00396CB989